MVRSRSTSNSGKLGLAVGEWVSHLSSRCKREPVVSHAGPGGGWSFLGGTRGLGVLGALPAHGYTTARS